MSGNEQYLVDGSKFKALLFQKSVEVNQLADKAGLRRQTIMNLIKSADQRRGPAITTLGRIAEALQMDLLDFLKSTLLYYTSEEEMKKQIAKKDRKQEDKEDTQRREEKREGADVLSLQAAIASRDAQIKALQERIGMAEAFSIDAVSDKFRALKDYYEAHLREWYSASLNQLEAEKNKAIDSKEEEFQLRIEEEIAKRRAVMKKYEEEDILPIAQFDMSNSQICGIYKVVGHNPHPERPGFSYFGDLYIGENGDVLTAKWEIGVMKQTHTGTGLLAGNLLAFSFQYTDLAGVLQTGVVSYRFIREDVMRGYWAFAGDRHRGFEECRKDFGQLP